MSSVDQPQKSFLFFVLDDPRVFWNVQKWGFRPAAGAKKMVKNDVLIEKHGYSPPCFGDLTTRGGVIT